MHSDPSVLKLDMIQVGSFDIADLYTYWIDNLFAKHMAISIAIP